MTRLEWIHRNAEPSILDVGCGHSEYFRKSFRKGEKHIEKRVEYLGIDRYKDPIDIGDPPSNFIIADAHNIPISDDSYTTVILGDVLEMVDKPVNVIKEAKRVAKEQMLLTVPNEDKWLSGVDLSDYEYPKRKYSSTKLIQQIMKAGIKRKDIEIDHTVDIPLAFWLAKVEL